jgi:hypothetical protein
MRWIPVSKELPTDNEWVLVTMTCGDDAPFGSGRHVDAVLYRDGEFKIDETDNEYGFYVIAWAHPDPYEGEE